jgi:hypothetical protein
MYVEGHGLTGHIIKNHSYIRLSASTRYHYIDPSSIVPHPYICIHHPSTHPTQTPQIKDHTHLSNYAPLLSVYLANALANALLAETFWLPTKLSMVIAIARSMSWGAQYSLRRILQNASVMRITASRWRTYCVY